MQIRYMRLLVMFDLPTKTDADKKQHTRFRNNIMKDGFDMIQYSIYQRICPNLDQIEKYKNRLIGYKPKTGAVRVLTVTNTQYEKMLFLVGQPTLQEKYIKNEQFTLF